MRFIIAILTSLLILSVACAAAPNTNNNNQNSIPNATLTVEEMPILCGDIRSINNFIFIKFNSRPALNAISDRGNHLLIYISADDTGFITIVETNGEAGCILAHGKTVPSNKPGSWQGL